MSGQQDVEYVTDVAQLNIPLEYHFLPMWRDGVSSMQTFGTNPQTCWFTSLGTGEGWRFDPVQNTKGQFGVKILNAGQYKSTPIDVKVTVVDYSSTDICIDFAKTFTKDKTTFNIHPKRSTVDRWVKLQYSFLDHNTGQPVSVKGSLRLYCMSQGEYARVSYANTDRIVLSGGLYASGDKLVPDTSQDGGSGKKEGRIFFTGSSYSITYGFSIGQLHSLDAPGIELDNDFELMTRPKIGWRYVDHFTREVIHPGIQVPSTLFADVTMNGTEFHQEVKGANGKDYIFYPDGDVYCNDEVIHPTVVDGKHYWTVNDIYYDCIFVMPYLPLYNITYVLNGGTNSDENPSRYSWISPDITFKEPEREGYLFTGWTYNNNPITNLPTNSKGDRELVASWVKKEYDITTEVVNGTIDASCKVDWMTSKTINYTPTPGYAIESITVDGTNVPVTSSNKTSYTFSDVVANHTIKVVYKIAKDKGITIKKYIDLSYEPFGDTVFHFKIVGKSLDNKDIVMYRSIDLTGLSSASKSVSILGLPSGAYKVYELTSNGYSISRISYDTGTQKGSHWEGNLVDTKTATVQFNNTLDDWEDYGHSDEIKNSLK